MMVKPIHVVCYSGGHSSALAAIETVRYVGKDNVILLNHDISPKVEHADTKRFKQEVADYLGLPITYCNAESWEESTPIDVCIKKKAFKVGNSPELCTYYLKTEPFMKWLKKNFPVKHEVAGEVIIVYGFDDNEQHRISRRNRIMLEAGYICDYPMRWRDRSIQNIKQIGVEPPKVYQTFKHANCIGCLKAGMRHWYVTYCLRPDIFEDAKRAEAIIGYSINKRFLKDLEYERFQTMKEAGIEPTELGISDQLFWQIAKKYFRI